MRTECRHRGGPDGRPSHRTTPDTATFAHLRWTFDIAVHMMLAAWNRPGRCGASGAHRRYGRGPV